MAKRFDIHEWQAKQRLAEQEEFTPDLEDDELKRSKIQQMMAKEKESEYELSDEEKDQLTDVTNEFIRKLTDVRGGNYSDDRLLAALQFIQLVIQDAEPMLYPDLDEGSPLNKLSEMQAVNQKTGKDITKFVIDYLTGEIDKSTFERASGISLGFKNQVKVSAEGIIPNSIGEVEVTGMEPDSGNMEKEFKVIGPQKVSEPLKDVTIEYNGQPYVVSFEYGDVISDSNERGGKDVWYEATAEDGTYFMVDVYEDAEGVVEDISWDTLEIEPPEGLEEQNTVAANTGFSIQPGNSMTYATKNAFGKKRKK